MELEFLKADTIEEIDIDIQDEAIQSNNNINGPNGSKYWL